MSRCFPYPPPGYVCNRATGDALIESIKIRKEKEKVKQEKKEQKRMKTEQKNNKKKEKNKEKERLNSIQTADGNHKRKQCCDEFEKSSVVNSKHVDQQKKIESEAERSSLTEEYGQPIVTESLCYSSDGTQSHAKKSKIEQSPANGSRTTQGKVIRFRLKKREPKNDHPADNIPSTSGRTKDFVPKVVEGHSFKDADYGITRANEQLAFNVLPSVRQESGTSLTNNLSTKKLSKPESAYNSLFSEWVPPIHFHATEINDVDDNWLLPSKKRTAEDKASLNAYDGLSGRQGMSFQPCAHPLPELDIYVLPYTVPF